MAGVKFYLIQHGEAKSEAEDPERFAQERVSASRGGFLPRRADNPNRFEGLYFFLPFVNK